MNLKKFDGRNGKNVSLAQSRINVKRVARILGCSDQSVYRLVEDKLLLPIGCNPVYGMYGNVSLVFKLGDVEEFMKSERYADMLQYRQRRAK